MPECVLLLKWNQPEKALKPLEYKVKLQGTGDEEDFFLMVYHPGLCVHNYQGRICHFISQGNRQLMHVLI